MNVPYKRCRVKPRLGRRRVGLSKIGRFSAASHGCARRIVGAQEPSRGAKGALGHEQPGRVQGVRAEPKPLCYPARTGFIVLSFMHAEASFQGDLVA